MGRFFSLQARSRALLLCAVLFFIGCVAATAWQEPMLAQRGFVTALMLCTLLVLLCVLARLALALVVSGGLFLALKFISTLKVRYLDSQLMPADFVYYIGSSLIGTLAHYPHLYALGIGLLVLLPPLFWLVWRGDWRLFDTRTPRQALALRLGGMALGAAAFWLVMLPAGPFARVHSRNVWEKLSDDAQLTNFFVSFNDAGVSLPAMSDDATAERDWAGTATGVAGTSHAPYPDIVQVLEESTFDPSNYVACNVPQCAVPEMFKPDARTRAHGPLRVHTFGGGTWVSEFASLTGMPQDIFGAGGMYAPFVLAPHMRNALPQMLRRLGYLTIAIYPTDGNFINGRNAYQAYGFDHLYDAGELGLKVWDESDEQMFDAAKRTYDKVRKPGQPVFMMILTLHQHGPHDDNPMSSLPPPYRNLLHGLSKSTALNFDTYLSRLHESALAMRGLEHDFLDRPQPTVLMHFGDHQPSFDGQIRRLQRSVPTALQPYHDYLTYFMLKSNVAGPPLPNYPMLDIAYLPSMVLEAAGLPRDSYFSAATALRVRCNGLYDDCMVPTVIPSYHAWVFDLLHVYQ